MAQRGFVRAFVAAGCIVAGAIAFGSDGTGFGLEGTARAQEAVAAGPDDTAAASLGSPMTFNLSNGEVQVIYGTANGVPVLHLRDARQNLTFTTTQIATTISAAGAMISVYIQRTVDGNSLSFSFFLPRVIMPNNATETAVEVPAISVVHKLGIGRVNTGQLDIFKTSTLRGVATTPPSP
jgi:hypothetical protein